MPLVCEVVKNCKLKNNTHQPIPFKNVFNVNIFIRLSGRIYTDDYQLLPQGGMRNIVCNVSIFMSTHNSCQGRLGELNYFLKRRKMRNGWKHSSFSF